MGIRLKKATLHVLKTPQEVKNLAGKLKAYGGTECERSMKDKRKSNIRSVIIKHEMRPFTWAVGEVLDADHQGLIRRVDGQHSSEVFLELTPEEWKQVLFPVYVLWEEHECDTMQDLAVLFEQFNPSWSSRTPEDLIGAHLGIHQTDEGESFLAKISRRLALTVCSGLRWYARSVEGKGNSDLFQFVHDDHDTHAFMLWCASFMDVKKTGELCFPAVIGAIRHVFRADDEAGKQFWQDVALGKPHNEEATPAYKLASFLELLNDNQAEWPRTISKHFKNKRPSDVQVFATCLNAYRAHREGRRIGEVFEPAKGQKIKDVAEKVALAMSEAA